MNPITRKEMFLAAAGGQNVETPTPVTREEAFLDAIAKVGGGGSSGGGVLVVHHDENGVLDKTWQEIHDAGVSVLVVEDGSTVYINHCMAIDSTAHSWSVLYANTESDGTTYAYSYVASSADGYPSYTE